MSDDTSGKPPAPKQEPPPPPPPPEDVGHYRVTEGDKRKQDIVTGSSLALPPSPPENPGFSVYEKDYSSASNDKPSTKNSPPAPKQEPPPPPPPPEDVGANSATRSKSNPKGK